MISVILLLVLMAMIYVDHRKVMKELEALRALASKPNDCRKSDIIV